MLYKHLVFFSLIFLISCTAKNSAPVYNYGLKNENKSGTHIVRKDDTVFSIADRYGLSMRAIIARNNLSAPFVINAGDRLILPPPNTHKVKEGDSLYTVSRTYGVDMTRLSRMNNLSAPYRLYPGQTLKLPVTDEQLQSQSFIAAKPNEKPSYQTASRVSSVSKEPIPEKQRQFYAPPASTGKFQWPVRGRILSSYGPKSGGLHNDGINIEGKRGDSVKVADTGVVAYVGDQIQGYGNMVLIKHENRYMTAYAHLDTIDVRRGQKVSKGSFIGKLGSSGNVSSPQLHFEIRKGTKAVNPQTLL